MLKQHLEELLKHTPQTQDSALFATTSQKLSILSPQGVSNLDFHRLVILPKKNALT
jgi:hypothetical protein